DPSQRDGGSDGVAVLFHQRLGHVGGNEARRHGVAGDVPRSQLPGGGLGEADDASLGGGIVNLAGITHDSGDGADVYDAAVAGAHHDGRHVADEVEGAFEVGVDDQVKVGLLHGGQQAVPGDAGVVDKNLYAAKVGLDL